MSNNIDILGGADGRVVGLQSAGNRTGGIGAGTLCRAQHPCRIARQDQGNLADHLAYQAQLERAQQLAFAGPMSDESGTQMEGMGLIIYRAESLEAARKLAEADPMHQSGARMFVLRRWMINEGSLTLNVGLSTGAATMR